MSKRTERQCTGCGQTFQGITNKCLRCQEIERTCIACGEAFRGRYRKCYPCRVAEQVCAVCGETFRAPKTRTCANCRRRDPHACATCGKDFRGTSRDCPTCRVVPRQCVSCGRTFRANGNLICFRCRASKRTCSDCGNSFSGTQYTCRRCQNIDRECQDCGKTFRGSERLCCSCSGRAAAGNNGRRARRAAVGATGPLPPSVYRRIRSSGPCVYCDAAAETVDHVRPLARGGHEAEDNLVPACTSCNSRKSWKLLTEWDPGRVAHGVAHSPLVAAELERLKAAA